MSSAQAQPAPSSRRAARPLPLAATGRPAPFRLGAPAYLVALAGWVVAAVLLLASAEELAALAVADTGTAAAAHAVGLVFFPFAVAAAAWQLLPMMLRNDPPRPRLRWPTLALLAAGVPLTVAIAGDHGTVGAISAAFLCAGLLLLLGEVASLVRGAPTGRVVAVNRLAVALAAAHAAAAFALGVVVLADGGPEPLGVPYERLLLVHISVALVGWLTMLILGVGRTLIPMLGLAAAAPRRRAPVAELGLAAGLWLFAAGVASAIDPLVLTGVIVMTGGLAEPALRFVHVGRSGRIGMREGPVGHVAVGLCFVLQAAVLACLASVDVVTGRTAAVAAVLLLGIGWVGGVIVGHLGKLLSLSGWGAWPPGPRPKQAALYPRPGWQLEVATFAIGVQVAAAGVLSSSAALTRTGAALLLVSAVVACACSLETVRRVVTGLRRRRAVRPGPGLAGQTGP